MNKYRFLVLEDDIERIKHFMKRFKEIDCYVDYTNKADIAIEFLKKNKYDIAFLDHDLGQQQMVPIEEENTGSAVARFMNENNYPSKDSHIVIIHSFNPNGAENMNNLIKGSIKIPAIWLKSIFDNNLKIEGKQNVK